VVVFKVVIIYSGIPAGYDGINRFVGAAKMAVVLRGKIRSKLRRFGLIFGVFFF